LYDQTSSEVTPLATPKRAWAEDRPGGDFGAGMPNIQCAH